MNGKDNIIQRILTDAGDKCDKIIENATENATQILSECENAIDIERKAINERVEKQKAEQLQNALAKAQLDARKYKLAQKQKLIQSCYEKAQRKLTDLTDRERMDFLRKLLNTYAENGETVLVSQRDSRFVTQVFLDGIGKNLILGKTYLNADGGVILVGKTYTKDLTLPQLIAYARQNTEGAVADALFGNERS